MKKQQESKNTEGITGVLDEARSEVKKQKRAQIQQTSEPAGPVSHPFIIDQPSNRHPPTLHPICLA
jgi:hypothetical protein